MDVQILLAVPEDAEEIQHVFYTTWMATYPNEQHGITVDDLKYRYKDAFSKETLDKRRKMIKEMGDNELLLVAKYKTKLIGVCYLEKDKSKNELQAMYILPDYQGKRIGTGFWKEAQNFFDHSKDIIVNVAVYNTKAIEFYKKLGFIDTGKRFSEERFRMKSGSILTEMEMAIKAKKETEAAFK